MLASGLVNPDASQFEEPILQIRKRIEELSALEPEPAHQTEIDELRLKLTKVSHEIYSKLTPWQKTLVARHAQRPYTLDFIGFLFEDFTEIHGDRKFGDDAAIVAGFARFKGQACAIVGAMFCERHARIVAARWRDRIRVKYGTEVGLHAHRVVAAVDVQRRAGHVARAVAEQVGGRRADVVGRDVAVQRRALLDDVLPRREAGD